MCKLITNYIIVLFLVFSGCKILKNKSNAHFVIADAFYYSWFAEKNEYGTNVQIKLKNVDPEVKFDSLIFRNIRIPVYVSEEKTEISLKGVIPGEQYSFTRIELERVKKSNRLIYNYRGKRCFYIIDKIRREPIRYY